MELSGGNGWLMPCAVEYCWNSFRVFYCSKLKVTIIPQN